MLFIEMQSEACGIAIAVGDARIAGQDEQDIARQRRRRGILLIVQVGRFGSGTEVRWCVVRRVRSL